MARRIKPGGLNQVLVAAIVAGMAAGQPAQAGTIVGTVRVSGGAVRLSDFVIFVDDIDVPPVPGPEAVMSQKNMRFVPHVLAISVGTTVAFPNGDPVAHNVFSVSSAKRFNLGLYPKGTVRRMKFDRPGVVELLCNVHTEMSAYIVVMRNPYFAVTRADGTYRIPDVPSGRRRLRTWHPRLPAQEKEVVVPEHGMMNVMLDVPREEHAPEAAPLDRPAPTEE